MLSNRVGQDRINSSPLLPLLLLRQLPNTKVIHHGLRRSSLELRIMEDDSIIRSTDDLKDILECPVCLKIPTEIPIFQCNAGHIHCKECRPNLTRCPMCRLELKEENRSLMTEKILSRYVLELVFKIHFKFKQRPYFEPKYFGKGIQNMYFALNITLPCARHLRPRLQIFRNFIW